MVGLGLRVGGQADLVTVGGFGLGVEDRGNLESTADLEVEWLRFSELISPVSHIRTLAKFSLSPHVRWSDFLELIATALAR